MTRKLFVAVAFVAVGISGVYSAQSVEPEALKQAPSDPVERGRYIVLQVAMCYQCHSPRDERGVIIEEMLLAGAPVPVEPPYQKMDWASAAPHLRGMPGYDEDSAVRLLTTGIGRNGMRPRLPMPPFRMSEEDARAVYAFLNSL
ncbi:MAG: c-type cytochrome [Candidatus Hydrogenedentales bacterium]